MILIYKLEDLSLDFIISLLVSRNLKSKIYDSILVIIDRLMKIVHYKLVMITFNADGFAKTIIIRV